MQGRNEILKNGIAKTNKRESQKNLWDQLPWLPESQRRERERDTHTQMHGAGKVTGPLTKLMIQIVDRFAGKISTSDRQINTFRFLTP